MQSSMNSNILWTDELVQNIIPFLNMFVRMQSITNSDILRTDELVQNIIPFLDIFIRMQISTNSNILRTDELIQNITYHSLIYHFSSAGTCVLQFLVKKTNNQPTTRVFQTVQYWVCMVANNQPTTRVFPESSFSWQSCLF